VLHRKSRPEVWVVTSKKNRTARSSIVLFVGGVTMLASLLGVAIVGRDLPVRQTVGLQSRAERHHRATIDHAQDSVGRCIDAVPIDRRRCTAADDARDRDFFRNVPHKR
jgi:hypothetical protein